jgi:polyhydroxyalkanoate synthesis regulator protein
VTLGDLGRMLLAGMRFVVHDAKTGEDITKSVLDRLH